MAGNILVPIDLNHKRTWQPVLPVAVELARSRATTLHLITVVPKLSSGSGLPSGADYGEDVPALDDYSHKMQKMMEREMEAFIKAYLPEDVPVKSQVAMGSVYRRVLEAASRNKVQLIIMSGYSPTLRSFMLGTSAERIARHAKCSIYIVRP
nr:universal stress protein [uncultured Halomonas sp.]